MPSREIKFPRKTGKKKKFNYKKKRAGLFCTPKTMLTAKMIILMSVCVN